MVGTPRFRTRIFKSHSLRSIWPVLAELCSASSEGIADERKKRRIAVKPKSADDYVGRPNNTRIHWSSKVYMLRAICGAARFTSCAAQFRNRVCVICKFQTTNLTLTITLILTLAKSKCAAQLTNCTAPQNACNKNTKTVLHYYSEELRLQLTCGVFAVLFAAVPDPVEPTGNKSHIVSINMWTSVQNNENFFNTMK